MAAALHFLFAVGFAVIVFSTLLQTAVLNTATRQRPFPKYIVMGGVMMTFVGVGPQITVSMNVFEGF